MATRRFLSVILKQSCRACFIGVQRNARWFCRNVAIIGGTGSALISVSMVSLKASESDKLYEDIFMAEPISGSDTLKTSTEMMHKMELLCMQLQRKLCKEIEKMEGTTKFRVDRWLKSQHIKGGGVTCVMEDGCIFERAGVNISVVSGELKSAAVKAMNSQGRELPENEKMQFSAVGISSVIHPRNPNCPTMHFNYRYFEVIPESSERQWWFGGGSDLTPYYLDEQDVKHFHGVYKAACDKHGSSYYQKFKQWCDKYFYIPHRCHLGFVRYKSANIEGQWGIWAEGRRQFQIFIFQDMRRGVGGIFFDDFKLLSPDASFNFVKSCADAVIPSYLPIIEKHKDDGYGLRERDWQLMRRGYYAEFNLVHDRGTKFGFATPGARYESILMSLPPKASWKYCYEPEPNSKEAKLVDVLRNPRDWI